MGKPRRWRRRGCRAPTRSSTSLDDLENLWEVAEPDRARFARAIATVARAPAAAGPSVGRGVPGATGAGRSRPRPWSAGSTIRPRSSGARPPGPCGGSATRALASGRDRRGTRGARTRECAAGPPGSSPINSMAWIPGLDLAESLIELTRDPDLWTRLQALRTLRQWFYRTSDPALARRIVETYLARMAEPDVRSCART